MYEITFILKEEDASPIGKIFSSHGVEVQPAAEIRKIRLAYPIMKSEYGFLGSFRFEAKPEDLEKISKELKLEKNLFRYMVAKFEEKKAGTRDAGRVPQAVAVYKKQEESKRRTDPVLTNEELEKKIEEILK
ncbi:MAG: 30S ribosomal protein S6 [Candidatus Jorgensenbacteria bacterium]